MENVEEKTEKVLLFVRSLGGGEIRGICPFIKWWNDKIISRSEMYYARLIYKIEQISVYDNYSVDDIVEILVKSGTVEGEIVAGYYARFLLETTPKGGTGVGELIANRPIFFSSRLLCYPILQILKLEKECAFQMLELKSVGKYFPEKLKKKLFPEYFRQKEDIFLKTYENMIVPLDKAFTAVSLAHVSEDVPVEGTLAYCPLYEVKEHLFELWKKIK